MPLIVVDIDRTQAASRNVAVQDILDTVEAIGGHIGARPVIVDNAIIGTQVRLDPAWRHPPPPLARCRSGGWTGRGMRCCHRWRMCMKSMGRRA